MVEVGSHSQFSPTPGPAVPDTHRPSASRALAHLRPTAVMEGRHGKGTSPRFRKGNRATERANNLPRGHTAAEQ